MAVVLALMGPFAAGAEPLDLQIDAPLELRCETRSLVVAEKKFEATRGEATIRMLLEGGVGSAPGVGRWWPSGTADAHVAGFAAVHRDACRNGCPMVATAGRPIELWAPVRASLDSVAGDVLLTVAVLDRQTMALKVSTFRAAELYALEDGLCRPVTTKP